MSINKLNTSLRNKYNPEGSQLREIQLRELSILVEFDRICRKYNIDYWLDSGSLIGAVRHGGFIPWDDDIDVCIRKKDRKKLKLAMEKSLSSNYEYLEAGTESNYKYPGLEKNAKRTITRLYDKNAFLKRKLKKSTFIVSDNLWLDIFFMEPGTFTSKNLIENTYGKCLRRVWNFIDDGKFKHRLAVLAYPFTVVLKMLVTCWCGLFHKNTLVHSYGNTFFSIRKVSDIFPLSEIEFTSAQKVALQDIESLDPPLLFIGEPGTGKRLLALAAHQQRSPGLFRCGRHTPYGRGPQSVFRCRAGCCKQALSGRMAS